MPYIIKCAMSLPSPPRTPVTNHPPPKMPTPFLGLTPKQAPILDNCQGAKDKCDKRKKSGQFEA